MDVMEAMRKPSAENARTPLDYSSASESKLLDRLRTH